MGLFRPSFKVRDALIGTVLQGRYRVEERIGHTFQNGYSLAELWTEVYGDEPVEESSEPALNDERIREPYSTHELALLYKVATQAAVALENSRVYEKLRERDRLAALGEMSAGLAHEIRNPLGAISGCVQMLSERSGDGPDEAWNRLMGIIVRETKHLNRWIGEFLGYARPRPPELETLDVARLARDTVLLARQDPELAAGVDVAFEGPDEAWVRADAGQVRQVLWNLVQNALQAVTDQDERRVRVEVDVVERGTDAETRVRVIDNGPGIPKEDQASVFEPFFTTRQGGTGLGLATVHRIVQNHRGQIRLRSTPSHGTTFEVVLHGTLRPAAREVVGA